MPLAELHPVGKGVFFAGEIEFTSQEKSSREEEIARACNGKVDIVIATEFHKTCQELSKTMGKIGIEFLGYGKWDYETMLERLFPKLRGKRVLFLCRAGESSSVNAATLAVYRGARIQNVLRFIPTERLGWNEQDIEQLEEAQKLRERMLPRIKAVSRAARLRKRMLNRKAF